MIEDLKHTYLKMTRSMWGYWLLLGLPLLNASVSVIYINSVDLEWLYSSRLTQSYDQQMTQILLKSQLAHSILWQWAKLSFWPTILFGLKVILVGFLTVAIAQFFNSKMKLKNLFLIGLWSNVSLIFTVIVSSLHMLVSEMPLRMKINELDLLSWNSILKIEGDGALQFFTAFEGPIVVLNIFLLAFLFKSESHRLEEASEGRIGWGQSIFFATLPYLLFLGTEYYIFAVVFSG